jgi:hypothetical protein
MANQQVKIITPEKLQEIRYSLPKSWIGAIGVLKKKRINPLQYQRRIRKGWGKRLAKIAP